MAEPRAPLLLRVWRLDSRFLNGWIASLFMVGAALFALGCALYLLGSDDAFVLDSIFFVGSIFFTAAAFSQLHQVLGGEAGSTKTRREIIRRACNRQSIDVPLMSAFSQFVGTLMFNINTFDAFFELQWFAEGLLVWTPNIMGSLLFQLSGSLALYEITGRWWSWPTIRRRQGIHWWIGYINFVGCVAFLVSALLAFFVAAWAASGSVIFTLLGACCFFVAALLMWPEMYSRKGAKPSCGRNV
ncbi:hypothetical protein A9Q88_10400 [Gammaproteobacteria bacterium 50_400_T64]|nr:hypothetical protein A9Q88_10400 [Gammaproteobacteria bacterium 50_400_T64]